MNLTDYQKDLFQEIAIVADVSGCFLEDAFFEKVGECLLDAGEVPSVDRCQYIGPKGSGVRVDGYAGDPDEAEGILSLFVLDFDATDGSGRLTATEMNVAFGRLEKFVKKAIDRKWRDALEDSSHGAGLAELIAARWEKIHRIRFFLLTNRELSDRVDGRDAGEIGGKTVTYSVWDVKRLFRFEIEGRGKEELTVNFREELGHTLPVLPADFGSEEYKSYLLVFPGEDLAKIYDRWGARLLEQNVRVFLQAKSNVNKGIKRTIEQEPERFFAYNNGITATAEDIDLDTSQGVQLVSLKNLQIVNGGQTTASIHAAHRAKIDLSKVFVQVKLSIVDPDLASQIVPLISEYANSQNRVNAADFFANHPFHTRMEEFSRRLFAPAQDGTFKQTKWFYERARGQYADARSRLATANRKIFEAEHPRSQLFSKTDLAKFLNVWELKPDKVSLGAQKNFASFAQDIGQLWEKSNQEFGEVFFRQAIAKAIVFKKTERIVSAQPWYDGGYRAQIVAYGIGKLAHDVKFMGKSLDFMKIWSDQDISQAMTEALERATFAAKEVLTSPPRGVSNIGEWAKKAACWSQLQAKQIDWPERFLKRLIDKDEWRTVVADGAQEQKKLSAAEAQIMVFNAGGAFWSSALEWAKENIDVTPKDVGLLATAKAIDSGKIPTERQSQAIMVIYDRLRDEGFPREMPKKQR